MCSSDLLPRVLSLGKAAYLGASYSPFAPDSDPNSDGFQVRNLKLPGVVDAKRLGRRRELLKELDTIRRDIDARGDIEGLDTFYREGLEMVTDTKAQRAFDVQREPAKLRERYGRHDLGQCCLLARRLVEAGVTFVTVNTEPWDHHGTANRLATEPGARKLIPPFDRALAALVEDLIARGLFERTLVVAMGEFGRTPRMNSAGGRDHWGNAFSVLMGCGGMKMGQAVGKSTPRGEYVADRPLSPQDVAATVYHHLGIAAAKVSFLDAQRRPIYLIEDGQPIRELVG